MWIGIGIILAIAIFGYLIHANSPETKFQKALSILEQGNAELALQQLSEIKEQHDKAGVKIAEIKLQIAETSLRNNNTEKGLVQLQEVFEVQKNIKRTSIDKTSLKSIEQKASTEIAKIYFQKAQDFLKKGHKDLANESFEETLRWYSTLEGFIDIKQEIYKELSKLQYEIGVEKEQKREFEKCLTNYKKALSYLSWFSSETIHYNAELKKIYLRTICKICIVQIKTKTLPEQNILDEIVAKNIAQTEYRDEVLFRYSYLLAKQQDFTNAIKYASLITNKNKDVLDLITYCKEYYAKIALKEVERVNEVMFSDNLNHTNKLYNDFDKIVLTIKKGLPELLKETEKVKLYLFSKLINQYFESNEFESVISHITKFPNFYEQPELLKNMGIACLRLANDGKITSSNYQNIISTWLTAVYSDRVILNSLETTYWDDDYTFTLVNSIGSHYIFDNDVENVNFEEVSDDNISIGETQIELLSFFEKVLIQISDNKLAKQVQDFYRQEKEAIEKVIETISTEIVYAPPYFAKQHNFQDIILNYLANEFESEQDISILQIGLRYVKNSKPFIFEQFENAQNFVANCANAIRQKNVLILKSQNSTTNQTALVKFSNLKTSFEEQMIRAFDSIIETEEENENLIPLFEEVINLSPTKEQLKYQFANFIIDLSIAKVNSKKMKNEKGLELLIKAYQLNKDSARVSQNLAIIAKLNCVDMLNKNISNSCRTQLESLNKIKNSLLTQNLRNELGEVFNGIIGQIRQGGAENAKLFEDYIGIKKAQNPFSIFSELNVHRFDMNQPSLNSAGIELAKKLKLIYELTQ
jgi:hypothetical protein